MIEDNSADKDQNTEPLSFDHSRENAKQRNRIILITGIGIVILLAFAAGVYFLSTTSVETTSRIRDIFIIFMALESLVIGLTLVILIVQIATLINLIQNEIKPILNSTNETVNTLRGTASFMSDHLVEPVMKLNEYLAGLRKLFDLIRIAKKQN